MGLFFKDGGLFFSNGSLAMSSNCCCNNVGPCAKCGLPTGPTPPLGICTYLCYPDGPQLYLDFATTGCDFQDMSFVHVPLGGVGALIGQHIDGQLAENCFSVILGRDANPSRPDGPYFIGESSVPYETAIGVPLAATEWDCEAEYEAALAVGCVENEIDFNYGCNWGLNFLIQCENVNSEWTGRYQIMWTYFGGHIPQCQYENDFAPAYDYTLTATKTWAVDGAVDLTFVIVRTPTISGCYYCCERTFTFRIYS